MSQWFLFALIAPAIYACNNFIDKYLLSRRFSDYNILPLYTGLIALIVGIIFYVIFGQPSLSLQDMFIVLLTGILTFASLMLYVQALSKEETSSVILLFQMTPVFTLILSYFVLGEAIGFQQVIGFLFVLIASLGISYKKEKEGFVLTKTFFLILGCDLLWAASGVMMKFATNVNSIQSVLVYESFGLGLGAVLAYMFFPDLRRALHKNVRTLSRGTLAILSINELVYVSAKSLTYFAFSLGPVAMVGVLGNTQIFFGLMYGYILNKIAPQIFREDFNRVNLTKKIVFACILFVGILLIY